MDWDEAAQSQGENQVYAFARPAPDGDLAPCFITRKLLKRMPMRHLGSIVFLAVLSLAGSFISLSAQTLLSDPVLDWNALMIEAIRADSTAPTLSTRNLAILHTS